LKKHPLSLDGPHLHADPEKYVLMGYCIDFLDKLKEKLKFSDEIYLVPDGNYGS